MVSGAAGQGGGGAGKNPRVVRETPVAGSIPRYEVPDWHRRYGVIAGVTGRGDGGGDGFDLGLWSMRPVGKVMSRWLAFRREMAGFHAVALGNQVHGVEVMALESGEGWIQVEGIDGWITTAPGILLTITVADCIPVYLIAPGRAVGLLHAGWRGTAGEILRRGVARLKEAADVSEAGIVMHCGVGICGTCYEVGSDVVAACGMPVDGAGPWHVDLRERLVAQALDLGLSSVTTSSWCSSHDGAQFFSHRASRGNDGRMVGYIGML